VDNGSILLKAKLFTYSSRSDRNITICVAAIGIARTKRGELLNLGNGRRNCRYNTSIYTLADLQALINDR
jgi:hypothetical protein